MPELPDDLTRSQLFIFDSLAGTLVRGASSGRLGENEPLFSMILPAGKILDKKYKIISKLGEGGMAVVYHAHHQQLDKDIALKTFKSKEYTAEAWRLFEKEVKTLARLNDKHIVHIYDFGFTEDKIPFFTMEFLQGQTLAQKLEGEVLVDLKVFLPCFIQVCSGLEAAHRKNILHRDIKPANIFLQNASGDNKKDISQKQIVKILDFGIAALTLDEANTQETTGNGACYGSPLYMSPEQASGQELTAAADIYSLGCSLYQVLSGAPPLRGDSILATLLKHQHEVPRPLTSGDGSTFPNRLVALVAKMLEKDPGKRPQTAAEVAAELQAILALNLPTTHRRVPGTISGATSKEESGQTSSGLFHNGVSEFFSRRNIAVGAVLSAIAIGLTSWNIFRTTAHEQEETRQVRAIFSRSPLSNEIQNTIPHQEKTLTVTSYLQHDKATARPGFKHFHFPTMAGLGTIDYAQGEKSISEPMSGDVYVPISAKLCLSAKRRLAEHPELFDGFEANDLESIRLHDLAAVEVMSDLNWKDTHFHHIARLTGLKELEFIDAGPTAAVCNDLNKLTQLEKLCMFGQRSDVSWLTRLVRLQKLKVLRVSEASNIVPFLKQLAPSKNLIYLGIQHSNATMQDLKLVSEIKSLQRLCVNENPKITDEAIPILAQLPELRDLEAASTGLTASVIFKLPLLKKLQGISVSAGLLDRRQREYAEQCLGRHITVREPKTERDGA
ncbi:MAG: serine/threonine protein kinase [Cyanobacteria bacterium REEB67]|nr:serine/threonine protein kinase [Cyanobacteria bacterium REEB67]